VSLADRTFVLMPTLACGTIQPTRVNARHKQFLIRERSAFVLAGSYRHMVAQLFKNARGCATRPIAPPQA
jgi:hypothetical protein